MVAPISPSHPPIWERKSTIVLYSIQNFPEYVKPQFYLVRKRECYTAPNRASRKPTAPVMRAATTASQCLPGFSLMAFRSAAMVAS